MQSKTESAAGLGGIYADQRRMAPDPACATEGPALQYWCLRLPYRQKADIYVNTFCRKVDIKSII